MEQPSSYLNENYQTAAERGQVAPHIFGHVAIASPRFEAMREWYMTVLNAEPMFENPMVCFMTYDDEHHRIALINIPDLKDRAPDAAGVAHLSFTYRNIDELMSTFYRLREAGMEPYWTILHGPTLSMYYRDPDGGSVELQIDCFETLAETMAWFATGTYDENPIGIKVEIEDIFDRYKAGEPLSELLKRRSLNPGESPFDHMVM